MITKNNLKLNYLCTYAKCWLLYTRGNCINVVGMCEYERKRDEPSGATLIRLSMPAQMTGSMSAGTDDTALYSRSKLTNQINKTPMKLEIWPFILYYLKVTKSAEFGIKLNLIIFALCSTFWTSSVIHIVGSPNKLNIEFYLGLLKTSESTHICL